MVDQVYGLYQTIDVPHGSKLDLRNEGAEIHAGTDGESKGLADPSQNNLIVIIYFLLISQIYLGKTENIIEFEHNQPHG